MRASSTRRWPGQYWEQSRIEQDAEEGIVRYLNNLYEVQNREKSLFDAIEYESEVERQFARDLDNNENVKLFVKLPWWFKVDTPIGPYNPDWAFVTEREEKLYFVRETKGTTGRGRIADQGEPEDCLRQAALRDAGRRLRRGDIACGSRDIAVVIRTSKLYADGSKRRSRRELYCMSL